MEGTVYTTERGGINVQQATFVHVVKDSWFFQCLTWNRCIRHVHLTELDHVTVFFPPLFSHFWY